MKLREIGEFELIERMAKVFRREDAVSDKVVAAFSKLAIGIGDDAAVWEETEGRYSIATTDAMVEGIHFTRSTTNWYDLGWKAMASNISDIAGMGGVPLYGLATLAARGDQEVEAVLDFCRGMADVAARFGAAIVGGDTVSSPLTMVSITLIGQTTSGKRADGSLPLLSRFVARPGDLVAVTGNLGSSAGGLDLLLHGQRPISERYNPLLEAHRRPNPRVREGQLLVEAGVRCGMDMSDGLVGDLTRICKAAGVSAVIDVDKLPINPLLRDALGDKAVDLALSGGEDYELLCTGPAEIIDKARLLLDSAGMALTVVGKLTEQDKNLQPISLVDAEGRCYVPKRSGWEHFTEDGSAARS
ncbi:MAG: thiamine-phosphate kinase [Chloroflexota bacterium]